MHSLAPGMQGPFRVLCSRQKHARVQRPHVGLRPDPLDPEEKLEKSGYKPASFKSVSGVILFPPKVFKRIAGWQKRNTSLSHSLTHSLTMWGVGNTAGLCGRQVVYWVESKLTKFPCRCRFLESVGCEWCKGFPLQTQCSHLKANSQKYMCQGKQKENFIPEHVHPRN